MMTIDRENWVLRLLMAAALSVAFFVGAAFAWEPKDFLTQRNCAWSDHQDATTPMCWRKRDFGGYQSSDSYLAADGRVVQTFDFAPFGTAEFGSDGGQVLSVDRSGTVRVDETRDGGTPANQFFVGRNCGNWWSGYGTGWIVWKSDVSTTPKSVVASLSDSPSPTECPPLNKALTRYWTGYVGFPNLSPISIIVSEHYDAATIGASKNMERMYFGLDLGLIGWEAHSKTRTDGVELAMRCPVTPWRDTPAADGFRLVDCRIWTNFPSVSGFSPSQFFWP